MKKCFLIALVALNIFGCGKEVSFNSPFFQGDRNNQLWRAVTFSASISTNGFLTITGTNGVETVNLSTPSVVEDTPFIFGDVNTIAAQYIDGTQTLYSTNNRPQESISLYPELGELTITEIDYTNATFSGTFNFLAFNNAGSTSVGYANGSFYKVPLISGTFPTDPITCSDTEAETATALAAYNASIGVSEPGTFYNSVEYEDACSAYVAALNNQRNYCGDIDGTLQALIDSLDCTYNCEFATYNVAEALSQFDLQTITMGNYISLCNQYSFYLQEQITFCGDTDGGIQALIDGLNCLDTDVDGVPDVYEDTNGDGNFDNDDTDGDLNADYIDEDDDDDLVPTALEAIFDDDGNALDTDEDGIPDYLDADDDGDGVPTRDEDLDGDGNPTNDDTDGDGIANYLDTDDDNDGILSVFEDVNNTGNPADDDTDGDMTPNYLDIDDDGDSVHTIYEFADINNDGNPFDARDFDTDFTPDYLDVDDDNDGILTINENPDPNGDGNPDDALNSDADSAPDYLDNN